MLNLRKIRIRIRLGSARLTEVTEKENKMEKIVKEILQEKYTDLSDMNFHIERALKLLAQ